MVGVLQLVMAFALISRQSKFQVPARDAICTVSAFNSRNTLLHFVELLGIFNKILPAQGTRIWLDSTRRKFDPDLMKC
jgi:hypothetical protein